MSTSNGLVPDQSSSLNSNDLPTNGNRKGRKRSSKSVRIRKSMARRLVLNKFCAEKIEKSLKINIIEIDGDDVDFTDAFAFFTWYLDNYSRLENVPRAMAIKFREQYMAFDLDKEGEEFLKENIRHKFLFDDAYYEKFENSDSDESIYDERHKSDSTPDEFSIPSQDAPVVSPTYRAMSPVYCPSTVCSESSCDTEPGEIASPEPEVEVQQENLVEMEPVAETFGNRAPRLLYIDYGASRLINQMTDADFEWINAYKTKLLSRKTGKMKYRYHQHTVYLPVERVLNFYPKEDEPLVSMSSEQWTRRFALNILHPEFVVKPCDSRIVELVAMG